MRSKNILSVAAFIAAFAFSAAFASLFITKTYTESRTVSVNDYQSSSCFKYKSNSAAAKKISALVQQDHLNGRTSNRDAFEFNAGVLSSNDSVFSGYAEAVNRYVDLSSAMEIGDLPSDFQAEWREHMQAWREYGQFLNRMKNVSSRESLTVGELQEIDNFHSREITRTWEETLQIGVMNGAHVY